MRAVQTDQTNTVLTLPGGTEKNDLPAQRIRAFDPETEQDAPAEPNAFETTWILTEAERESVASGAPVQLIVWGKGHPPVSMSVPIVEAAQRAVDRDHLTRGIGAFYATLKEGGWLEPTEGDEIEPVAFWQLFEKALEQAAEVTDADRLVAELKARAEETAEQKLDRQRHERLQKHDGDAIAAGAEYALEAEGIVSRAQAIDAAVTVFGLDDVQRAAVADRIRQNRDAQLEPYVHDGTDVENLRRSAQICRDEVDTLERADERRPVLLDRAARFDRQAARLEGQS